MAEWKDGTVWSASSGSVQHRNRRIGAETTTYFFPQRWVENFGSPSFTMII
jgi:hypothetical protein